MTRTNLFSRGSTKTRSDDQGSHILKDLEKVFLNDTPIYMFYTGVGGGAKRVCGCFAGSKNVFY